MAKQLVFSVFDILTKAHSTPFFAPHPGSALRSFEELARDEKSTVAKHPHDFELYQIGEFDIDSGVLTPVSPLIPLGRASNYLNK